MSESESLKRDLAKSYDDSADIFAELADRLVFSHLAPLLDRAGPTPDAWVLDVAGGTGAVARRWKRVVCCDISHGQLTHNEVPLKVQGDGERLPFADDSFGAVLCSFGINHFPDPVTAVREMARVAPSVGVMTWVRPDPEPYKPREIVMQTLAEHADKGRTETGDRLDEMTNKVGSVEAISQIFETAGVPAEVEQIQAEIPWEPGSTERFVDYRLSMLGAEKLTDDVGTVRKEAIVRIDALPAAELTWRPLVVLATGRRS